MSEYCNFKCPKCENKITSDSCKQEELEVKELLPNAYITIPYGCEYCGHTGLLHFELTEIS